MKNFDLILDILADKIAEKDREILLLKWKVDDLVKKLEDAECHINSTPEQAKQLEIR